MYKVEKSKPILPVKYYALNSVVVFDWDDTLYATSYIRNKKCVNKVKLDILDNIVIKLFTKIMKTSTICIITNSVEGWVSVSASINSPKLWSFLNEHNIQIISARSQFKYMSSGWKEEAFRSLLLGYTGNIMSIGDSESERKAAIIVTRGDCKIIKFIVNSSVNTLISLIESLCDSIDNILYSKYNVDLIM
jgi:hypothetical protein